MNYIYLMLDEKKNHALGKVGYAAILKAEYMLTHLTTQKFSALAQ